MRTVPDPIPDNLKNAYLAVYEYAMLELGHPVDVEWVGPRGLSVGGENIPNDDLKFFVGNLARAALGLEVDNDRDGWQAATDTLNAAKALGIKIGEDRYRTYTLGNNKFSVNGTTFTVTGVKSVYVNWPGELN